MLKLKKKRNVTLSPSFPVILREWSDRRIPLRASSAAGLKGNSKGIGAIEVIIALAILGVVAVAFLGGLSTAFKTVFITGERSVAQSLAQSQMESVKNQDYKLADPNSEVTYNKTAEIPQGYYIMSIHRDGSIADDVDGVIGVPWNPEASPPAPSTDDNGIQKITVIIYHDTKKVLTLEDYKVNR